MSATWEEFERLRLTVGVITEVEDFPEARVPAYKLTIHFGPETGTKRSSAQLTHYAKKDLLGRQVVCVLGFEPKRIAGFPSEVLVLGAYSAEHGVVLLQPDRWRGGAGRASRDPPHPTSRARAGAAARSAVRTGVVRRGARAPARGPAAR